ncbi:uncharacterized protein A1O9_03316 [Exophiala aquamarina CBS 119918]|uniref:Uncharacterized protein n=1 Tax=Exophiala aquamarina CBS 119918 TaxID=1182545 RepID=A0A072PPE3_9EURO|nr:uncharacterized protein A1O9_03316 [Exophiala aquamarina CBS 119918]KEF61746.1 hypothetical protein A1O9_03316 [Exophiala aquamarina CBS 119918]
MPTAIIATTLQAAVLSTISNILAQFIKSKREKRSYGISVRPLLHFVVFTLISCPPNILWQEYLELKFPGYTYHAATGEKTLDKGNTARKLLFDQTLSAFVNTVAFVAAMAAFKGKGLRAVQREVERDVIPLMISSWKLWPLVAIINFTLIPVDRRVILSSVVGLFWGIYLSLFAALD